MTKIYIVVGYDYEYSVLKLGFRLEKAAEALVKAFNSNENDSYAYKVEEVELIE